MEIVTPVDSYRGRQVDPLWSPSVTVIEVLLSVKISQKTYHGIRAKYVDELLWDLPGGESLLWVFDDGYVLRLCQEMYQQGPRIMNDSLQFDIEAIIGSYQNDTGNVFLGIKWRGCDHPTWELEDDLVRCGVFSSNFELKFWRGM
ncbi:hypothetical protein M441DRAFT_70200 [Trichoderma asperellum CBS 433.97]|uniref:Chromo domain-containing protein n=1 Tax=Trichoderma asperellum (strain ATCC 204424 / CBS 433.97 / NBRC 101777) TaxID=1042311 RepID=A0A2T3Z6F4_TRIA4|nr:hypothetical protein M441DRAFT_70200 [Trichoderma asperellum CBS 433.97]PTB40389.1 hypothetical protein M441DRAFT_70200 [Trichoderma asperellum CBS 433.97]